MDKMLLSRISACRTGFISFKYESDWDGSLQRSHSSSSARPLCQRLSLSLLLFSDFLISRSSDKTFIILKGLLSVVLSSQRGNMKHAEDEKAVITVSEPLRNNSSWGRWSDCEIWELRICCAVFFNSGCSIFSSEKFAALHKTPINLTKSHLVHFLVV